MRTALFWLLLALPALGDEASEAAMLAGPRPVVSEIVSLTALTRPNFVGEVAAKTEADLGFPIAGTVASRPVDVGQLVEKGDLIAQLDPEDLDADVSTGEAGVLIARTQLRAATDAEKRARDLAERGVDASTRLEDATSALAAASARMEQAEATLARARDMRGLATLTAPQDGVITVVYAESGASLTGGQPIVRLTGTDGREIVVDLIEQDIASLDIGAEFDVVLAAMPDISVTAKLYRIDPVAERTTRTRRLHLTLDDAPPSFRLGALAKVSLVTTSEAGLSIPLSAIRTKDDVAEVWVVDRATDTVASKPVTLGMTFAERVRIKSGLKVGDEIVLKGIYSLEDGQIVGPQMHP